MDFTALQHNLQSLFQNCMILTHKRKKQTSIKVIKCATGTITDVYIKIIYANITITHILCVYIYIYL